MHSQRHRGELHALSKLLTPRLPPEGKRRHDRRAVEVPGAQRHPPGEIQQPQHCEGNVAVRGIGVDGAEGVGLDGQQRVSPAQRLGERLGTFRPHSFGRCIHSQAAEGDDRHGNPGELEGQVPMRNNAHAHHQCCNLPEAAGYRAPGSSHARVRHDVINQSPRGGDQQVIGTVHHTVTQHRGQQHFVSVLQHGCTGHPPEAQPRNDTEPNDETTPPEVVARPAHQRLTEEAHQRREHPA
mmetsp:Transcript_94891/g.253712  ORF Transcript_94891/g.253712 Transcript_94891/m.253712 type:complete len:239 (-) Transcript_94891:160-876(-)